MAVNQRGDRPYNQCSNFGQGAEFAAFALGGASLLLGLVTAAIIAARRRNWRYILWTPLLAVLWLVPLLITAVALLRLSGPGG